ncbi:MAG: hypothetical protein C3F06_02465 [Candidatus Methanoperedenaceae archaeon]|nr:MAG: hypothetical protein C3F06_02465 [Candidatus Methanoperedenaceae archaeon]
MGLFSNVSNFVGKKLKERDTRKKEEQEISQIRQKALHEERKKQAPILARKQASLEVNQKVAKIKSGKAIGGYGITDLQNLAHGIGQSTGSQFNKDFNNLFGGGSSGKMHAKKSNPLMGPPNAFNDEFNKMFGGSMAKGLHGSKTHKKATKGKTIIIKV